MTNEKCVLSFDLGASGGRAVLGAYEGSRIRMEELHRFTNDPVHLGRTMYWDVLGCPAALSRDEAGAAEGARA